MTDLNMTTQQFATAISILYGAWVWRHFRSSCLIVGMIHH
jgi:hypothetical protein